MSPLEEMLALCGAERRAAVAVHLVAGVGGLDATLERVRALEADGIDLVLLELPYRAPILAPPGRVTAAEVALAAGTTLAATLEAVSRVRNAVAASLVLASAWNPILAYGPDRLAEQAAASGLDALLVRDLPLELAITEFWPVASAHGLAVIPEVALEGHRERSERAQRAPAPLLVLDAWAAGPLAAPAAAARLAKAARRLGRASGRAVLVDAEFAGPEAAAAVARTAAGVVLGETADRAGAAGDGARRAELAAAVRTARRTGT